MSALTELTQSPLCIVLDIRHPLAYLALGPAIDFGREMKIDIDWLPFEGRSLREPTTPGADDDRGVLHRRHRANMIAREIAIYSQAAGLTLLEPYRTGPSHAATLAWLWVRAQAPESLPSFLEELFRRYWALEMDVIDLAGVAEVLRAQGLHSREFDDWAEAEGPAAAESIASSLDATGVFQAPAYLIEDEVFFGRQHLAMIRWILSDRTGPGPI
ncbi:MAG: hypothetical protein GY725_19815 [bacterium]|nr:hypothetical protein [bacterium]